MAKHGILLNFCGMSDNVFIIVFTILMSKIFEIMMSVCYVKRIRICVFNTYIPSSVKFNMFIKCTCGCLCDLISATMCK